MKMPKNQGVSLYLTLKTIKKDTFFYLSLAIMKT